MTIRSFPGIPALAVAAALAGFAVLVALPAAAQVRPGSGGFGSSTRGVDVQDELMLHVLRRTSYGPTAESLAEIRRLGVDEYLWRQLHPEQLDDSALETRLATTLPDPDDVLFQQPQFRHEVLVRALASERQLQEVMTQFWDNHFITRVPTGGDDPQRHAWTDQERWENQLFRENAFGRFRDLIEFSAKSQAMMYYLDNHRNSVASGNENYARELLELHSLGVDCGYDQGDVEEVARIWTGWTGGYLVRDPTDPSLELHDLDGDGETDFVFNPRAHDFGEKDTLGEVFPPGGGTADGERVLDIVSSHPCTARFLSTKLLELFVTDAPSEDLVDRIAAVFLDTEGDVRRVLWAIFQAPEFRDPAFFGNKVKTPLEYTISAQRALDAEVTTGNDSNYGHLETWYHVRNQGMALYEFDIPTGFDETAASWVSANGFLQRWKYADQLSQWRPGATRPTSIVPMTTVEAHGLQTADEVVDFYSRLLLGRILPEERRARMREVLLQGLPDFDPSDGAQDGRLREMIAHLLGSPEFQKQ